MSEIDESGSDERRRDEEEIADATESLPGSEPALLDATDEEISWFLIGSGILLTLILLLRRPKRVVDWLIPLGLIGAGLFFLYHQGQVLWNRREARKQTAIEVIQAELEKLDPIARVEVLKAVGEQQLGIDEAKR